MIRNQLQEKNCKTPKHIKVKQYITTQSMGHHNIKPQSRWLEQQKSIPHSSGGKKSKIKVPGDKHHSEASFPDWQEAATLLCAHMPAVSAHTRE